MRFLLQIFLIMFICFNFFSGCKPQENKDFDTIAQTQNVNQHILDSLNQIKENYIVTYHYLAPEKTNFIKQVKSIYNDDQIKIILALNRIDKLKKDTLIVPDTLVSDFNFYSPFPKEFPLANNIKKLVFFSQKIQAFASYEFGKLYFWGPTSMGKKSTPTPNGLFHTNWKAKSTISTDNPEWILPWCFNLDNRTGVSLHQFELPGYPASHACTRLLEEDAKRFYYWAEQWILSKDQRVVEAYGTPVIIFGKYETSRIWRQLPKDSTIALISEDELKAELEPYYSLISNRQYQRDSLLTAPKDTLK